MFNVGLNAEERFGQILENQKIFEESVAPLAKRFHKFLLTHQPYDVIMVPSFDVSAVKWSGGKVKFEDFALLFTGTSSSNSRDSDSPGLNYHCEIWEEYTDISQYFCVPFSYLENPNEWERKALLPSSKRKQK